MMIKEHRSSIFTVLRFLAKCGLVVLQAMIYFVSEEERPRPPYGVLKAKELHEEGLISNAELARAIHGNDSI